MIIHGVPGYSGTSALQKPRFALQGGLLEASFFGGTEGLARRRVLTQLTNHVNLFSMVFQQGSRAGVDNSWEQHEAVYQLGASSPQLFTRVLEVFLHRWRRIGPLRGRCPEKKPSPQRGRAYLPDPCFNMFEKKKK